jgi:large subunit ribosomal protein L22
VTPRKVRIVADEIRGKTAMEGAHALRYQPSKGAAFLRKVLVSAIANAVENHGANAEQLRISKILVDTGPKIKRITQKAQGRGARIIKKMAHITVVVEDFQPSEVKPHGTKAKPRPKFEVPKRGRPKATAAPVASEDAQAPTPVETVEAPAEELVETAPEPPAADRDATDQPVAESGAEAAESAPEAPDQTEEKPEN